MNHLVEYFLKGGSLMWPILLCSILSWAIIAERAIRLRRKRLIDEALVKEVQASLGRGDLSGAEELAKAQPVLVGLILGKGLNEYRYTEADIETALQGCAAASGLFLLCMNGNRGVVPQRARSRMVPKEGLEPSHLVGTRF